MAGLVEHHEAGQVERSLNQASGVRVLGSQSAHSRSLSGQRHLIGGDAQNAYNMYMTEGEGDVEIVQRVRKTDLARNTHQVIRAVQRGQTAVIENHGEPEAARRRS